MTILTFRQAILTWGCSYEICDENGWHVFTAKKQRGLARTVKLYDQSGRELGRIEQKLFSVLPKYELYIGQKYAGYISLEKTCFKQEFKVFFCGWRVEGDFYDCNYAFIDKKWGTVATVIRKPVNFADTYIINIYSVENTIPVLLLMLAIDAEKSTVNRDDVSL